MHRSHDRRWLADDAGLHFITADFDWVVVPGFRASFRSGFNRGHRRWAHRYQKGLAMTVSLPEAEQNTLRRGLRRAKDKEIQPRSGAEALVPINVRLHVDDLNLIEDWALREGRDRSTGIRFAVALFADLLRRYPAAGG